MEQLLYIMILVIASGGGGRGIFSLSMGGALQKLIEKYWSRIRKSTTILEICIIKQHGRLF